MSEDKLLSALKESERNFDKTRIEEIKKKFNDSRHKFSKSKINKIRKDFYEMENEKDLSVSRLKEIKENLLEVEKNISKSKKYDDYDDYEYKGIRSMRNLLVDKDYKPVIIDVAFNSNYVQYESVEGKDKDKNLLVKEFLDRIKTCVSYMINKHKAQGKKWRIHSGNKVIECITQGEFKIQLTMVINFISSIPDSDETRIMRTKSDNIAFVMGSETDEVIEELFKSFLQRYQEGLKESMRGSNFIFDRLDALYYDLNKISLSRGGSYIDSLEWLKNKKATINPKNNDDKCFQYALTVNYKQIKNHPERISNIKSFIDQYNWKEIDFPPHIKNWKNNNQIINQLLLTFCVCLTILKK